MRSIVTLLFSVALYANTCAATKTGTFTDPTVWSTCGGTYPHDGDTFTVASTYVVTVPAGTYTVGNNSGPKYSYVESATMTNGSTCAAGFSWPNTANMGNVIRASAYCTDGSPAPTVTIHERGVGITAANATAQLTCGTNCTIDWVVAAGTPAVTLSGTARLVVDGGTLLIKGDIYSNSTASAANHGALELVNGGRIAQAPGLILTTNTSLTVPARYTINLEGSNNATTGGLYAHCGTQGVNTACSIDGLRLKSGSAAYGPNLDWINVALSNAGGPEYSIHQWLHANNSIQIVDSTLDTSGGIRALLLSGASVFSVDHAVATNIQGPCGLAVGTNGNVAVTTGTRLIKNSDIGRWCDVYGAGKLTETSIIFPHTFTFIGNYTDDEPIIAQTYQIARWENNFMRLKATPQIAPYVILNNDQTDSVLMVDAPVPVDNPHVTEISGTWSNIVYTGLVMETTGSVTNADPGEWAEPSNTPYATILQNSFLLPGPQGLACCELTSLNKVGTNGGFYVLNNVLTQGQDTGTQSFGLIDYDENMTTNPGNVQLMGNVVWSPSASRTYYKLDKRSNSASSNVCGDPALCDYNLWLNWAAPPVDCTGLSSQSCDAASAALGYQGVFTTTTAKPGTHDLTADPQFVDYKRNAVLWDMKYYCVKNPSACSSYAPYVRNTRTINQGDVVTYSRAGLYWGEPISYRCIAVGGCTNAPYPGDQGQFTINRVTSIQRAAYTGVGDCTGSATGSLVTTQGALDIQCGDVVRISQHVTAPGTTPSNCSSADGQWVVALGGACGGLSGSKRFVVTQIVSANSFKIALDSSGLVGNLGDGRADAYNDWRTYWEWESIQRFRDSIKNKEKFSDPALLGHRSGTAPGPYTWTGCNQEPGGCNVVAAYIGWIRAGFISQASGGRRYCTGSVCTQPDLGAVPFATSTYAVGASDVHRIPYTF